MYAYLIQLYLTYVYNAYIGISRTRSAVTVLVVVACIVMLVLILYGGGYFHSLFFTVIYNFNLHHSKSLPYRSETFIGRETEVQELIQFVNFTNRHVRIVNIIGSPGFGKSTLAIHVGHRMVENGVIVHYINMAEFPDKNVGQVLCEKVLESAEIITTDNSVSRLMKWAGERFWYNLLILDNCDDSLHHQKEEFQKVVEDIILYSSNVKIVLTSRETTMHLEWFKEYKLYELSTKAACDLLDLKVHGSLKQNEREEIAELTGKVPLALQIIGSLLTLHDPPTPTEIITALRKQPIVTLSPHRLPISKQLNASFSLSYIYLGPKLQKIGRYLANFPGSFDREAAYEILRRVAKNASVTESYIATSMRELVDRSLLEHSVRSDRYNFHLLIKEFFLHIQSTNRKMEERRLFLVNFQWYFTEKLYSMTKRFSGPEFKNALRFLDVERHNVQYFLNITGARRNEDFPYSKHAMSSLYIVLTTKYLHCRFTAEELLIPVRGVTHVLEVQLTQVCLDKPSVTDNLRLFISYLIQLSLLIKELKGTLAAVKEMNAHTPLIDEMSSEYPGVNKQYTNFYIYLSQLSTEIGDENGVKECSTKLLQKVNQLESCTPKTCEYKDIGQAYFHTQDYEKSARNIELALKLNTEYGVWDKAIMTVNLIVSYIHLNKLEEKEKAIAQLVELLPEVLSSPNSVLFIYSNFLTTIARLIGDDYATRLMKHKQLEVLRDVGKRGDLNTVIMVYDFADILCDHGNYTESIDMAEFALDSFNHLERHEQERNLGKKLKLELLIGKAKHYTSGSIEVFENITDLLVKLDKVDEYKGEFMEACGYLPLWHRQADCFEIINKISTIGGFAIYGVFAIPLVIDRDETESEESDYIPKYLHQKLSWQSDSKEVVLVQNSIEVFFNTYVPTDGFVHTGQYVLERTLKYFMEIIKYKVLRILINIVSIIIRLYILYYGVLFLYYFTLYWWHRFYDHILYSIYPSYFIY